MHFSTSLIFADQHTLHHYFVLLLLFYCMGMSPSIDPSQSGRIVDRRSSRVILELCCCCGPQIKMSTWSAVTGDGRHLKPPARQHLKLRLCSTFDNHPVLTLIMRMVDWDHFRSSIRVFWKTRLLQRLIRSIKPISLKRRVQFPAAQIETSSRITERWVICPKKLIFNYSSSSPAPPLGCKGDPN